MLPIQQARIQSQTLIKGYEDGSFKPDGAITRAAFVVLVNRSFGLNDKSEVKVKR
ncbi:S-layer homology domain-containing protein [Paenibacillus sp. N3.4]|uniref:S-layer homology domain-containing protein n=1 Tax=Paenibacillus sp. N3.4 TaxID=2603222 RepID=UPI0011CC7893|nr:S-layer homology domain-containing protein [Paenibacillus sp. N3.4]